MCAPGAAPYMTDQEGGQAYLSKKYGHKKGAGLNAIDLAE